jgi:hypothetical protein
MSENLQPSNTQTSKPGTELCLRLGNAIFGVSFTDLTDAREAARHINLTGRDVEIYERNTGKVLESLKGVTINPPPRPAPPYFVTVPEVAIPAGPRVDEPENNPRLSYG